MYIYHMYDIFAENYRLQHITYNDPPHYGLIIDTNNTMREYEMCIGMKKIMGTGRIL